MTYLTNTYSQTNIWGKITGLPTWVSYDRQHGKQITHKVFGVHGDMKGVVCVWYTDLWRVVCVCCSCTVDAIDLL